MENMTINLEEAFENKEKAKEIIEKVQNAFKKLADEALGALKAARESAKLNDEYEEQVKNLNKSNSEMLGAIKNIHTILGSRKELFNEDEGMKTVMDSLAVFVLSSSSIKMGVIANANAIDNV